MTIRTALKCVLILLVAAVLLSMAAFAWVRLAPRRVPAGQPPLTVLEAGSLSAFRDAFNASGGQVRLVVMLSPT